MPRIDPRERRIVIIASTLAALFVVVNAAAAHGLSPAFEEFVALAAILALFPVAAVETLDVMWKRSADESLPDVLRSIARAMEGGATFERAVLTTSEAYRGPLSKHLRRMAIKLSWGVPHGEALRDFAHAVGTKMARLVAVLIDGAMRVSGPMEVLSSSADFVSAMTELSRTRRSEVRPYLMVIYVGYFVFLFVIVLLYRTFLMPFVAGPIIPGPGLIMGLPELKRSLFHMIVVQAICCGLAIGKMEEGTIVAGFKHAVFMLLVGFVTYKLFL